MDAFTAVIEHTHMYLSDYHFDFPADREHVLMNEHRFGVDGTPCSECLVFKSTLVHNVS